MTVEVPVMDLLTFETYNGSSWVAWTGDLTRIEVHRGGKQSGATTSVEPGLLTATLKDAGDPLTVATLKPNVPVRLRKTSTSEPLFTGTVVDLNTTYEYSIPERDIIPYVTITACDGAKGMSNTKRGNVSVDPGSNVTWSTKIVNLFSNLPDSEFNALPTITYPADSSATSPYLLPGYVLDASFAEHIEILNTTADASWWVDRQNVAQFKLNDDTDSAIATFTDVRTASQYEYVAIDASYDTRNLVNDIDVTNHGWAIGTPDARKYFPDIASASDSPWPAPSFVARDDEYRLADEASVTTWGDRPDSLDMNMYTGLTLYTNVMPQPGFEGGSTTMGTSLATGASARAIVTSSPSPHSGINSLRWTAAAGDSNLRFAPDGTDGWQAATPGQIWRCSFWLRSSVARNVQAMIRFYSSASGGTGTLATTSSVAVTSSTSAWTRYTVTATAPASTLSVAAHVLTVSNSAGQFHYIDDVFVGVVTGTGVDPTSFSGDTPDTLSDIYEWVGTTNASSSIRRDFTQLSTRVLAILSKFGTPTVRISRIRWNAQDAAAFASTVEIQDRIDVNFRGSTQASRIVGISHEIEGTTWMVDFDLAAIV